MEGLFQSRGKTLTKTISVTFYPTKSFFPHAVYISQLGLVDTVNLQDINSEGKLYNS